MAGGEDGGLREQDTLLAQMSLVNTKPASLYQSSAALYWSSDEESSSKGDRSTRSHSEEEVTISNIFEVRVEGIFNHILVDNS